MKNNFIQCGLIGWCVEILFTGLHSLLNGHFQLMGQSSLWMFPIYGCASLIGPISRVCRKYPLVIRGLIYMMLIFFGEFFFGSILCAFHICPWDYSGSRFSIGGIIRLDYAPFWFVLGLFYEFFLKRQERQVS